MDARPDLLAETVRAKRVAIDNDLELLRVRLQKADPRRIDVAAAVRAAQPALAFLAASGAVFWWARRRRSVPNARTAPGEGTAGSVRDRAVAPVSACADAGESH